MCSDDPLTWINWPPRLQVSSHFFRYILQITTILKAWVFISDNPAILFLPLQYHVAHRARAKDRSCFGLLRVRPRAAHEQDIDTGEFSRTTHKKLLNVYQVVLYAV